MNYQVIVDPSYWREFETSMDVKNSTSIQLLNDLKEWKIFCNLTSIKEGEIIVPSENSKEEKLMKRFTGGLEESKVTCIYHMVSVNSTLVMVKPFNIVKHNIITVSELLINYKNMLAFEYEESKEKNTMNSEGSFKMNSILISESHDLLDRVQEALNNDRYNESQSKEVQELLSRMHHVGTYYLKGK